MKKLLPIALIVIGIALGIFGYSKFDESRAALSVGEVEIAATDESARTQAYLLLGAGALCVIVGVGMVRRSKP